MNEPRLWDDEAGDALERELLLSMRGDGPSPEARRKTLATLGLVGTGTAVATGLAAQKGLAAALAAKATHALLLKTMAMVVAVAAVVTAVAVTVHHRPQHPSGGGAPVAVTATTGATAAASAVPSQSSAPSSQPLPAASVAASAAPLSPAHATAPSTTKEASLSEAVALLDSVRHALDTSALELAFERLHRYDERFPHGPLRPEADLLRIETLVRRGDRKAAQELADDIAMRLPGSAHAQRAHDLLSTP